MGSLRCACRRGKNARCDTVAAEWLQLPAMQAAPKSSNSPRLPSTRTHTHTRTPRPCCRLICNTEKELASGRLPSVQPFHAMAFPFSPGLTLRISTAYARHCLRAAAALGPGPLPNPPSAPLRAGQRLRVAYVSSDLGNHPLSHLMGSVFGMHDRRWVPRRAGARCAAA